MNARDWVFEHLNRRSGLASDDLLEAVAEKCDSSWVERQSLASQLLEQVDDLKSGEGDVDMIKKLVEPIFACANIPPASAASIRLQINTQLVLQPVFQRQGSDPVDWDRFQAYLDKEFQGAVEGSPEYARRRELVELLQTGRRGSNKLGGLVRRLKSSFSPESFHLLLEGVAERAFGSKKSFLSRVEADCATRGYMPSAMVGTPAEEEHFQMFGRQRDEGEDSQETVEVTGRGARGEEEVQGGRDDRAGGAPGPRSPSGGGAARAEAAEAAAAAAERKRKGKAPADTGGAQAGPAPKAAKATPKKATPKKATPKRTPRRAPPPTAPARRHGVGFISVREAALMIADGTHIPAAMPKEYQLGLHEARKLAKRIINHREACRKRGKRARC